MKTIETIPSSLRPPSLVFEALSGSNRAAGSGGGSGLISMLALANQYTGAINQAFAGVAVTDVTNSSVVFTLARTSYVLLQASVWMAVTAGANFFYVASNIDGVIGDTALSGDGPKGYITGPLFQVAVLSQGDHTLKLQGWCDNAGTTGKIVLAHLYAYQLIA